jgi:hypothetical protein
MIQRRIAYIIFHNLRTHALDGLEPLVVCKLKPKMIASLALVPIDPQAISVI